jgi:Ala-tRNA(Pro) deacylase
MKVGLCLPLLVFFITLPDDREKERDVMMYARNLVKNYLDLQHVPYQHHVHSTAFTAQQLAAAERISGTLVAKTVVVKADDQFLMAVLPATAKVDTAALKSALNARELELATEREFQELFPDSDVGAMPPFGNLYELPVCAEESLARAEEIVFNAGTHEDAIRMRYSDFSRLVGPKICSFALQRKRPEF